MLTGKQASGRSSSHFWHWFQLTSRAFLPEIQSSFNFQELFHSQIYEINGKCQLVQKWVQDHLKLCHSLKIKGERGFSFFSLTKQSCNINFSPAELSACKQGDWEMQMIQEHEVCLNWESAKSRELSEHFGKQQLCHEVIVNLREQVFPQCSGLELFCRSHGFCRHSWQACNYFAGVLLAAEHSRLETQDFSSS